MDHKLNRMHDDGLLDREIYPRLTHQIIFGDRKYIERGTYILRECPQCGKKKFYAYYGKPYGFCYVTSCGYKVTWWQYIQTRENLSNGDTFKKLADLAGYHLPERHPHTSSMPKEKSVETFHEEMYRWGREQILSDPGKAILDYVIGRGFTRDEIGKRTEFCAIPHRKHFQEEFFKKGYTIEHLKASGLLAWGFGINYQLIFPVRDEHGKIVAWAGRLTVPGKDKEGEDLPKYKNTFGLHKNIPYNLSRAKRAIERTRQVIIVEGFMDAAHTFSKGFENVVAILGSRLLPDQMNHLVSAGATQILMCLDRDKDGEAGTELAFDLFGRFPHLHPYYVYLPPNCKDADETLKKFTKPDFEQILKSAQPGWLWYAERIGKEYQNNPDRDQLLNQYAAIYHKIADPVMQNEFIKTLSGQTEVGILTLRKRFGAVKTTKSQESSKTIVEDYERFLQEVKAVFEKETNLLVVRNLFHQKLSRTSFQSRNPFEKRFKGYLKAGLALCLRFDIEGIKTLTGQETAWVKEQSEMLPRTKIISLKG